MVNFKCYVWLEHLNGKLCFTSWGSSLFLNYLFRSQHCVVPAFPTNVCQMCVGSWGRWLHWFLYFTSVISRMLQKLLRFFFSSYKRLGLLYLSLGKEAGSECALLICYLVEWLLVYLIYNFFFPTHCLPALQEHLLPLCSLEMIRTQIRSNLQWFWSQVAMFESCANSLLTCMYNDVLNALWSLRDLFSCSEKVLFICTVIWRGG